MAQAVTNFKHGIDCYTYIPTKAISAMKSTFILHTIAKDIVKKIDFILNSINTFLDNKERFRHVIHIFKEMLYNEI